MVVKKADRDDCCYIDRGTRGNSFFFSGHSWHALSNSLLWITFVGLRTSVYSVYTVFWQGNHQIYGVRIRFWPTLHMKLDKARQALTQNPTRNAGRLLAFTPVYKHVHTSICHNVISHNAPPSPWAGAASWPWVYSGKKAAWVERRWARDPGLH